ISVNFESDRTIESNLVGIPVPVGLTGAAGANEDVAIGRSFAGVAGGDVAELLREKFERIGHMSDVDGALSGIEILRVMKELRRRDVLVIGNLGDKVLDQRLILFADEIGSGRPRISCKSRNEKTKAESSNDEGNEVPHTSPYKRRCARGCHSNE